MNNNTKGGLSVTINQLAQDCICEGLPVLPLFNDAKGPIIKDWPKLDPSECQKRWDTTSNNRLTTGLFLATCNLPDEWQHLFIVDIDEYDSKKQRHVLEELTGKGDIPPNAVKTASGGLHLYYSWPSSEKAKLKTKIKICGSSLDLLGGGLSGGIVLPPSRAKVDKASSPYLGSTCSYKLKTSDLVGWLRALPEIPQDAKEKIQSASETESILSSPIGESDQDESMLLGITAHLRRVLKIIPDGRFGDGERNEAAITLGHLVGINSINANAYGLVRDGVLAMVIPKVDFSTDSDGTKRDKFEEDFDRGVRYGHNDFTRHSTRLVAACEDALKSGKKGKLSRAVLIDAAERLFGGPPLLVIKMREGRPESYELVINQTKDTWAQAPRSMRAEFPKSFENEWMTFVVRRLGLGDQIEFSPLDNHNAAKALLKILKQEAIEVNLTEAPREVFLDCLCREVMDGILLYEASLKELKKSSRQKPWVDLWPQDEGRRKKEAVWLAPTRLNEPDLKVYFTDEWLNNVAREYCNLDGQLLAWLSKNAPTVNARDGQHIARYLPFSKLPESVQDEISSHLRVYPRTTPSIEAA